MDRAVGLLGALAFGAAVGFLNNVISGWAWRFGTRRPEPPAGGSGVAPSWAIAFGVQYVLRLGFSLASLYITYRVSRGDPVGLLFNLLGLLVARYLLIWRLSRAGGEGRII